GGGRRPAPRPCRARRPRPAGGPAGTAGRGPHPGRPGHPRPGRPGGGTAGPPPAAGGAGGEGAVISRVKGRLAKLERAAGATPGAAAAAGGTGWLEEYLAELRYLNDYLRARGRSLRPFVAAALEAMAKYGDPPPDFTIVGVAEALAPAVRPFAPPGL